MCYITLCDLCICRPVCMNKKYSDALHQCSIIQDKIRRISYIVTSGHLYFKTALLTGDTYFIINKYQKGLINISISSPSAYHYHIMTISITSLSHKDTIQNAS